MREADHLAWDREERLRGGMDARAAEGGRTFVLDNLRGRLFEERDGGLLLGVHVVLFLGARWVVL